MRRFITKVAKISLRTYWSCGHLSSTRFVKEERHPGLDGILVFSSIKKATGKTLCTGDVLDSGTGKKEKKRK